MIPDACDQPLLGTACQIRALMTRDALKKILDDLPDPSFVEGTQKVSERLAIALPDGDVGALDDKNFIGWLLEHSEDAPFGHNGVTKLDKKVRAAKRLVARGKAQIAGFEPTDVLPAIEAALSPRFHLDAALEDVIVYETGGKFARHKDTPRTPNLVGTLVVGLPIAHEGGGLEIIDGGKSKVVDWSGKPNAGAVSWVALFSDLDHAVNPVTSGARITLVYSLSRSDRPRTDAARDKRFAALRETTAAIELSPREPLMIACTRLVITDGKQPQSIDSLRGTDREIAEAFIDAGYDVKVRACLIGDNEEGDTPRFPALDEIWGITRLARALPDNVIASMDSLVSFTDSVEDDEYGTSDADATLLGKYVEDSLEIEAVIIRKRAAASAIYEGVYSETGYFGNEGSIGHLYTLAAIEISAKPTMKATTRAESKKAANKRR